jgi:uncharacterized protein (DUF433 family)
MLTAQQMDALPNAPLPIILIPHPHVRVDKNILGGSPYIAGSRVPVRRLWAFYRGGATIEVLMKRFPRLGAAKIFDALAFAFDNREVIERDQLREEFMLSVGGLPPAPPQLDLPFGTRRQAGGEKSKR